MCQLCAVTVIAGLGISRLLGIDDIVSSIWIGGLILSLSFLTIDWFTKKKWFSKIKSHLFPKLFDFSVFILMYLFVLIPLKLNHSIGVVRNSLWGIDKIILGIIVGSAVFILGIWADKKERKIKGRQLFKFQKVIFPALSLILASLVFWFITRYTHD